MPESRKCGHFACCNTSQFLPKGVNDLLVVFLIDSNRSSFMLCCVDGSLQTFQNKKLKKSLYEVL